MFGCFHATIQSVFLTHDQKTVSRPKGYLATTVERPTYLTTISSINRTVSTPLIDNIMIVMQK